MWSGSARKGRREQRGTKEGGRKGGRAGFLLQKLDVRSRQGRQAKVREAWGGGMDAKETNLLDTRVGRQVKEKSRECRQRKAKGKVRGPR